MIQPWFDPNQYAWIPGTAYGVIAGLMGAMVGWLVPRGRARGFILRAWFTVWAVAEEEEATERRDDTTLV